MPLEGVCLCFNSDRCNKKFRRWGSFNIFVVVILN